MIFQFTIINEISNNNFGISFPIGPSLGRGKGNERIPIALKQVGPVVANNSNGNLNYLEYYRLNVIQGQTSRPVTQVGTGLDFFQKPFDNAGTKTFPQGYATYANNFMYDINIPNCANPGRLFVGERRESFSFALGKFFDSFNFVPIELGFNSKLGGIPQDPASNVVRYFNIDSFILEIPTTCLTGSGNGVIGVWSSASSIHGNIQKSRIANPLVNELLIGIKDKDLWNRRAPYADASLNDYIRIPAFPQYISNLFVSYINKQLGKNYNTLAPTNFPRNDLVAVFLTGIPGLNQLPHVTKNGVELMRLNTSVPPVPPQSQNPLGVLAGDLAGYPNGRRPGDDIIDISARVLMGALCVAPFSPNFGCSPSNAPVGGVPFTDGSPIGALNFSSSWPYLNPSAPGSFDIL